MTGLHGLHVVAGLALIGIMLSLTGRQRITRDDHGKLENAGLYWHLVDLIWIYLFPLFYLIT
jgi:cytochrome c oxidase subunit 3